MLDLKRTKDILFRIDSSKLLYKDTCQQLGEAGEEREQVARACHLLEQSVDLARKCLEESLRRKQYIEEIISQALSEIYEELYEFELEMMFDDEGNIKGLRPRLRCEGGGWRNPQSSFGEGVSNIIDLCLQLVSISFIPGTQKFLFMDEPLSNISSGMQKRLESLLRTVCLGLGIQLAMISHQDSPFGKVYMVIKEEGVSRVNVRG